MGETELRVKASELNRLVVICHCGTELVFTSQIPPNDDDTRAITCPNCRMPVTGALQLVRAYRAFAAQIAVEPGRVEFLIKLATLPQ